MYYLPLSIFHQESIHFIEEQSQKLKIDRESV